MANKELAKRQKLTIRVEPSQRPLKARNAVAVEAKKKALATPDRHGASGESLQARLLKKLLGTQGRGRG